MSPVATTELYQELANRVRDIILVIAADTGRIVEANRAAEQAYQYSRGELLGLTICDLRVEPLRSPDERDRAVSWQGTLFETLHRRKDGSVFPVEVSSRGETFDHSHYMLSIIRDVTERKRAEEERERLLAATQQALATREEFLRIASHELRTPITIVHLLLHQLRRTIDRGDPAERLIASTNAALSHIDRLTDLVQQLLDASQLDKGPRLTFGDVDLAGVVRSAIARARSQTDAAGIEITVDVPDIRGRWDATRIEQVLVNLLSNALKYGQRQPVSVVARPDGDVVHIEVRDRGIGLDPSETGRIFGKFERAVSTSHYGGLGLGLYVSHQIIAAHRGWIEVQSEPGHGSTFRVTLPLQAEVAAH